MNWWNDDRSKMCECEARPRVVGCFFSPMQWNIITRKWVCFILLCRPTVWNGSKKKKKKERWIIIVWSTNVILPPMTRTKTQGWLFFSKSGQKKLGHSGQKKSGHQMATPVKFSTLIWGPWNKSSHIFSGENWVYMIFFMGWPIFFQGKMGHPWTFWGSLYITEGSLKNFCNYYHFFKKFICIRVQGPSVFVNSPIIMFRECGHCTVTDQKPI